MNFPFYDAFANVPLWAGIIGMLIVLFVLGYSGAPLWIWAIAGAAALYGIGAPAWLWITFGVLALVFNLPPLRRLLSLGVMKFMKAMRFLPKISETEKEAIDAGTVWVEGELFSGKPNWDRVLSQGYGDLTDEEQAFLDGPCEEVCSITDDWEVFQRRDLPPEVWEVLARHRFFGLIIPKEYGGHGFSASANSAVVKKVSSVNAVLGITVMVPNSLGPAELLIHYGTDEQKKYYLPRLARHEEIPAFALTEPMAGSDAGGLESTGIVFKGDDGELYLRLNWTKRYITLAAISTVLGLAFKLRDPDNLLGKGEDLGITCALVPSDTEGVVLGRRHDPLGIPFYNCPTDGHDVEVKLEEAIIGGREGAGKGWRMLMESLAAGRGISLPATSAGGAIHAGRVASAHAVVRKQFGLSIGKFEGIEEALARIGGFSYILEAARRYTVGGLDQGAKPAVVTAIMKYNSTELFRKAINDAMDILGGNAISRGPRNLVAHAYTNTPISITVEGANILTRTLMIFGQGAIRCHPYALREIQAMENWDVKEFDRAFWGHVGHVFRNLFRAKVLGLTRGRTASSPVSGPTAHYYRKLSWASSHFAVLADIAMGTLGGNLKRKEMLTGRFADIFSWMYLGAAVLKRYEAEGRLKEDLPFVHWSMAYALSQMQAAFEGLYQNMKIPALSWVLRGPGGAWLRMSRLSGPPSDRLSHQVASMMQVAGEQRERVLYGSYVPKDHKEPLGFLEHAMQLVLSAYRVEGKIKDAIRSGDLKKAAPAKLVATAVGKGIITSDEGSLLTEAAATAREAIQVDDFTLEEYKKTAIHLDDLDRTDYGVGVPSEVMS